jgi:YD repeat-containing protein
MAKTAAIYSRVSTSTNQSTSRQVNELITYADKLGYKIIPEDVFEEFRSGYSKRSERVEMNKMMEIIRKNNNKYKAIFVSEISRIARDPKIGREIVDELTSLNIPVYVKNPALVSIEENGRRSTMFNIIFQILLEIANTEAEFIKIRSRSGVLDKVKMGGAVGGIIQAYGYTSIKKKLTINEDEARVVVEIFDMCLSGKGTKTIANYLNANGIPTKFMTLFDKEIKQKDNRTPIHSKTISWKDGTVYGILTNPIYKGKRKLIRHDDLENVETIKVGNKTYNLFDAPPIVSEEVWEKAQITLKNNLKHSIRNKKFDYILKGVITCSKCGGSYYGRNKSDGKDKFYMCSSKRTKSRKCDNHGIGIEILESTVWTFLNFNSNVDSLLLDIDKNYNKALDQIKQHEIEVNLLTQEIEKEEAKSTRLKNLHLEGIIDIIEFKKRFTPIDNQIKKNRKSIHDLEKRINLNKEIVKGRNSVKEVSMVKKALIKDRIKISEIVTKLIDRISLLVIDREWAILSFKYKFGDWYYSVLLDRYRKLLIPITYDLTNGIDTILEYDEYGKLISNQDKIDEVVWFFSDEGRMGFREPLLWIPFS